MYGGIQQYGTDRQPDGNIYGTYKGHVDRSIGHLVRGSREIDGHRVICYGDRDDNREVFFIGFVAVQEPINVGCCLVSAIGHFGDC